MTGRCAFLPPISNLFFWLQCVMRYHCNAASHFDLIDVNLADEDRNGFAMLMVFGPVLEISLGLPSVDFGSIWSSQKCVNFDMFKKPPRGVLCILTPNHLTIINGERCLLARVLQGSIETLESFLILILRIIFLAQFSIHHWSSLVIINYCCPTVFYSINKAASLCSGIHFFP